MPRKKAVRLVGRRGSVSRMSPAGSSGPYGNVAEYPEALAGASAVEGGYKYVRAARKGKKTTSRGFGHLGKSAKGKAVTAGARKVVGETTKDMKMYGHLSRRQLGWMRGPDAKKLVNPRGRVKTRTWAAKQAKKEKILAMREIHNNPASSYGASGVAPKLPRRSKRVPLKPGEPLRAPGSKMRTTGVDAGRVGKAMSPLGMAAGHLAGGLGRGGRKAAGAASAGKKLSPQQMLNAAGFGGTKSVSLGSGRGYRAARSGMGSGQSFTVKKKPLPKSKLPPRSKELVVRQPSGVATRPSGPPPPKPGTAQPLNQGYGTVYSMGGPTYKAKPGLYPPPGGSKGKEIVLASGGKGVVPAGGGRAAGGAGGAGGGAGGSAGSAGAGASGGGRGGRSLAEMKPVGGDRAAAMAAAREKGAKYGQYAGIGALGVGAGTAGYMYGKKKGREKEREGR